MDRTDRFENWQRLGAGAHAVVYRAFDRELGCDVAVKLLKTEAAGHTSLVDGMRREVLISRQLRHANICPIHDLYEGPRGIGIVMDVIEGCDLSDWLRDNKGHTLATAPERLELIKTLTRTLEFAHTRIVHRDLKPSNIFLVNGEIANPVIMDFGISIMGEGENQGIAGTPKYMAPEQYLEPAKVGPQSDIFAMGIMAYEILTDQIPPNSLRSVLKTRKVPKLSMEDIPPPSVYCPAIPPALDRLIVQMIAYEAVDRPAGAGGVLSVLQKVELLSGEIKEGAGEEVGAIRIGGGETYLGSPPTSPSSNEKPSKRIMLSPYRIGATPVTNREYREFVKATGVPPAPLDSDPVYGRDDHPVVGLTHEQAAEYCKWTGGRLPTEAEWENAARAGQRFAAYPWGDEAPQTTQANIDGVWRTTSPVHAHIEGKNTLGLYDMCGNVWEWCQDLYEAEFYGTIAHGAENPVNLSRGSNRVLRGGSFQSFSTMGRCAFRHSAPPDEKQPDFGFRVVYDETNGSGEDA